MHDTLDPGVELLIEVLERAEATGGEERFANVAYATLDARLLISACHGDRLGCEVVVTGDLEYSRMKSDEVTLPLEYDTLQIVVEYGARHAAQPLKSLDVTAHETLEGLVKRESAKVARDQASTITKHDNRRSLLPTRSFRTSPSPLGLFGRQHRQPEECPCCGTGRILRT